ncbi:MAG TPA: ATP-binding protein, partial [Phnomibacter sp.]|nr:ATP-binding protein [Phnomibacter sp.]
SLGEMTAGIAHEIQNPLNFINNFSEVSVELFEEMEDELQKANTEVALEITGELKNNLQKIHHHSIRADKIVKAMLEHSRPSAGKRELTNLNDLVKESLKLSVHGMKAKLKDIPIETSFQGDHHLPPVLIIPQDINRVLVNMCNNALYSLHEKIVKTRDPDFRAALKVSTHLSGRQVQIRVSDNGTGIPEAVKPKIFQPFFTTKPAGEGTGLGLSLSYDIITQVHGGRLDVGSTEGQGTTFTITLPLP